MTSQIIREGHVKWQSPSNIALVKYWGKFGRQYPRNPSISFTLSAAHTETECIYKYHVSPMEGPIVRFLFEGKPNLKFEDKIKKFLSSVTDIFPFLLHLELDIHSVNSFPHSSGIASSASAMSALALCLLSIEAEVNDKEQIDYQQASVLSRLGSGSASRSVFGPLAVWGESKGVSGSSNDYAIAYGEDFDPIFHTFHDDILIISAEEKSVSSRAGHALMEGNPYAASRFEQADRHLNEIIESMRKGDMERFGQIVEKEALTLHALMMASDPPYILMQPNTIEVIRRIQAFREESHLPVYFTLDAGPNIHLLYPTNCTLAVERLKGELQAFCENELIIKDKVGSGPRRMI